MSQIEDVRKSRLKLAFDTLAAAGITQVTITFDGCGDSGQIEETTVEPEGKELPVHEIRWVRSQRNYEQNASGEWEWKTAFDTQAGKLSDLLESIVYDYMDKEHAGWENNDGAFGEFVFDVEHRTLNYDHNTRFTDSSLDVHKYKLEE